MIPRLFHRAWVGGDEPAWTRGYAATWLDHHPGWGLAAWVDGNVSRLSPLDNQAVYDAADAIAGPRAGQLRADVLRYELLWRFGGVWVDADYECLAPLTRLFHPSMVSAPVQADGSYANGLLSAPPGHPLIRALIDGIPASVAAQPGEAPRHLTGPYYLTRVAAERDGGVHPIPTELVLPYSHAEIAARNPTDRFPGALAVHHWHNRRREKGLLP